MYVQSNYRFLGAQLCIITDLLFKKVINRVCMCMCVCLCMVDECSVMLTKVNKIEEISIRLTKQAIHVRVI